MDVYRSPAGAFRANQDSHAFSLEAACELRSSSAVGMSLAVQIAVANDAVLKPELFTAYRQANMNPWTQLERIIKMTGLAPRPRPASLFPHQPERSSRLIHELGAQLACVWIDNSISVAQKHGSSFVASE